MQLYAQFKNTIERSIDELKNNSNTSSNLSIDLRVAYSGGMDSTVLLYLCHQFLSDNTKNASCALTISASHVNHGINQHAQTWQTHCQNICDSLSIPLTIIQFQLQKKPRRSLEADARDARYKALDESAISSLTNTTDQKDSNNKSIVLLAQHQDDQAETFLLQLKRGAGIKGLASMPQSFIRVTNWGDGDKTVNYLRPLLGATRAEIFDYAQSHELLWAEDESNQDTAYDRNFLRQNILPILQEKWPTIAKSISQSAHYCAQADAVNNEYMSLLCNKLTAVSPKQLLHESAKSYIRLDEFSLESPSTQAAFLRFFINQQIGSTPTATQLNDILGYCNIEARNAKHTDNKSPYIIINNFAIERYNNVLQIVELDSDQIQQNLKRSLEIDFSSNHSLKLNQRYSLVFVDSQRAEILDVKQTEHKGGSSSLTLTSAMSLPKRNIRCVFGANNLKFKAQSNRPTKKMKDWYKEWKISPLKRQQVPVFVQNDTVVAVGLAHAAQSADFASQEPLRPVILVVDKQ